MPDSKKSDKSKTAPKKKEEELYDDPFPGSVKDEKTGKYKHEKNRTID